MVDSFATGQKWFKIGSKLLTSPWDSPTRMLHTDDYCYIFPSCFSCTRWYQVQVLIQAKEQASICEPAGRSISPPGGFISTPTSD